MIRLFLGALALLTLSRAALADDAANLRFSFGTTAADGGTLVSSDQIYTPERGYGFEPGATVKALGPRGVTADQPFLFSAKVPEGNWRVTVKLGDPAGESDTTIKAESRRLMAEHVTTKRGEFAQRTFVVNIRNAKVPPPPLNAPGGDHVVLNDRELANGPGNGLVLHWDDKLTLEFNGPRPALCSLLLEPADNLPTIFVAGDSTVTDQPREPGASWGQMLPRWFTPEVAIANHAESGETLKSFISGLRLAKMLSLMKRGDWLLLQFGHNDEKVNWPQTYAEARTTYEAYLRVFIAEAQRRGVTPVLISPVQRRTFTPDGKIRNTHGDYPAAVRELAQEQHLAFIDLSTASATLYEALGPVKSPLAFSGVGDRRDGTHHDNYGAYEIAQCVAAAIREQHLPIAQYLVSDFHGFDPARPDNIDTFALPASPGRSTVAPRGN